MRPPRAMSLCSRPDCAARGANACSGRPRAARDESQRPASSAGRAAERACSCHGTPEALMRAADRLPGAARPAGDFHGAICTASTRPARGAHAGAKARPNRPRGSPTAHDSASPTLRANPSSSARADGAYKSGSRPPRIARLPRLHCEQRIRPSGRSPLLRWPPAEDPPTAPNRPFIRCRRTSVAGRYVTGTSRP